MPGRPAQSTRRATFPQEATTASAWTTSSPGSRPSWSTSTSPRSATTSGRSSPRSCRTWMSQWRTSHPPCVKLTKEYRWEGQSKPARTSLWDGYNQNYDACSFPDNEAVPVNDPKWRGPRLQPDPRQLCLCAELEHCSGDCSDSLYSCSGWWPFFVSFSIHDHCCRCTLSRASSKIQGKGKGVAMGSR